MPSHYAAALPNPFMPAEVVKPSRKPSARLERKTAKLESFLSQPTPRKPSKPRTPAKRSKAR